MNIYFLIIGSLILILLGGNAFYVAFKKYEDEDDFSGGVNTLSFIEFFVGILLFITEKFLSKRYHIAIFKTFSFLFGFFMICFAILLWALCTPFK